LTGTTETVATDHEMNLRTTTLHIDQVIVGRTNVGTWTDIEAFEARPAMFNPVTPFLNN